MSRSFRILLFLLVSCILLVKGSSQSIFNCFGKASTDPDACSGRGTCLGVNICLCNFNYFGLNCEVNICFNILSNITGSVCGGHGICTNTNTCVCDEGWRVTSDCTIPSCELLNSCSSHGSCIAPNICECDAGWKGDLNCSVPTCESILSCNLGVCGGPNTCSCKPGWNSSTNCSSYVCDNINCAANGMNCVGPNLCGNSSIVDNNLVNSGFLSLPNGGSINSIDTSTISISAQTGLTYCSFNDVPLFVRNISAFGDLQFTFETKYTFEQGGVFSAITGIILLSNTETNGMKEYLIFGSNYNGGPSFNVAVSGSFKTNDKGEEGCDIINPIQFVQQPGNTGSFQITTSTNEGYLKVIRQDAYYFLWRGSLIDEWSFVGSLTTVTSKFNYIGVFTSSYSGIYSANFTNIDFNVPVCNGKLATDETACPFANQVCSSFNGTCECKAGWTGDNCSVPICITPCLNGTCTAPNTCTCHQGYSGELCENNNICFGLPFDAPGVCNSRGTCKGNDKCECINGYTGNNCDVYNCFGITSNDSRVCSGRGTCIDNDVCSCSNSWKSATDCSLYSCEMLDNCGVKGTCIGPNQCSCTNGWKNDTKCNYSCDNSCGNGTLCVGPNLCGSPYFVGNENFNLTESDWGSITVYQSSPTIDLYINSGGAERNLWNCQNQKQANLALRNIEYPNFSFQTSYSIISIGYGFHSGIILYYEDVNNNTYFIMFGPNVLDNISTASSISIQASLDIDCQMTAQKLSKVNGNYGDFDKPYLNELSGDVKVIRSSQEGYSFFFRKNSGEAWSLIGFVRTNIVFTQVGLFLRTFDPYIWASTMIKYTNIEANTPQCDACLIENTECSGNNECVCKAGWKGSSTNCTIPSCELVNNCNNQGNCTGPNQCTCNDGYFGDSCQYTVCDGILSNSTAVCNGRGKCTKFNTCTCDAGYTGKSCSQITCQNNCNAAGTCVGPNQCLCNAGWKGLRYCNAPSCESAVPTTQTNRYCGKDLGDNYPIPNYEQTWIWNNPIATGFPKLQLNIINETTIKIQSTTTSSNVDYCNNLGGVYYREIPYYIGWSVEARMTNIIYDNNDYASGLILYIPNPKRYYLKLGFHAQNISLSGDLGNGCFENNMVAMPFTNIPDSLYFKISRTAHNAYQFYYRANVNDVWQIIGVIESTVNFNRVGYFTMGYTEYASATFTDFKLSLPSCNGKNYTDPTLCAGKGKCLSYDGCVCNNGAYGSFCNLYNCYGILSDKTNVCSGNGICEANNVCKCNEGFYGDKCEKNVCWGSMVNSRNGKVIRSVATTMCDRINKNLLLK